MFDSAELNGTQIALALIIGAGIGHTLWMFVTWCIRSFLLVRNRLDSMVPNNDGSNQ